MMSLTVRLLILWALSIALGTLAPFDFRAMSTFNEGSFRFLQYGPHERAPLHFLFNVILFVPFGALLHGEAQRHVPKVRPLVIFTAVTGLLISLTIEYLQGYLPSRDSSLIDVVANTTGALMGAFGDKAWGVGVERGFSRIRAHASSTTLASTMAAFMAVALLTTGALQHRTGLTNWSAEYPMLIGNERTGDRPWHGRVLALSITDAATPAGSVQRFAAGQSVALPGAPVVMFDFSGSPPYQDKAGNVPDIILEKPTSQSVGANAAIPVGFGPSLTSGNVSRPVRPWLQTAGPATSLTRRLRETNKFTLRVVCATDDTNQDGPARIVSNSFNTLLRNFTLGQQGADLVFRLRTPQTGDNGYPLETIVPGVFAVNQPRDILVTYDGATLLGGIAGTDQVFRTELSPAISLTSLVSTFTSQTIRTDQLPMLRIVYVGALFLPPGALIALLGSTRRRQMAFGCVYVVVASALLEITMVLASGRAFDWANIPIVAALGGVVFLGTTVTLSQRDSRPHDERHWRVATERSI